MFLMGAMILGLFGCADGSGDRIVINHYEVGVSEKLPIDVQFTGEPEAVTYQFEGNNIRIRDGVVEGLLSGTTTQVTAITPSGLRTTFDVTVPEQLYTATHPAAESEGWFREIQVEPIDNLSEDFPLGIDISMVQQVLDCGGTYYNADGVAENVYRILKDNGVNYVRIRLWNDPYNYFTDENGVEQKVPYGGGICDLDTVTEMAVDAKAAGLKVLLDFHYSDFWADPGRQVLPKAWKNLQTTAEIAEAIRTYTRETIEHLRDAGAMPDMVQIGNEITGGFPQQYPGPVNEELTGDSPYYLTRRTNMPNTLAGRQFTENFVTYVQAGIDGVKDVDDGILTMIHLAIELNKTGFAEQFFHQFDQLDYDIIGLSYYPYYHGTLDLFVDTIQSLKTAFPGKKIAVAEISYPYTFTSSAYASNSVNADTFSEKFPLGLYDISPQGQADLLHDVVSALCDTGVGYGIFWWEGCWLPVEGAGWADAKTKATWANQAFFSYDGKALPSLEMFNRFYGR